MIRRAWLDFIRRAQLDCLLILSQPIKSCPANDLLTNPKIIFWNFPKIINQLSRCEVFEWHKEPINYFIHRTFIAFPSQSRKSIFVAHNSAKLNMWSIFFFPCSRLSPHLGAIANFYALGSHFSFLLSSTFFMLHFTHRSYKSRIDFFNYRHLCYLQWSV